MRSNPTSNRSFSEDSFIGRRFQYIDTWTSLRGYITVVGRFHNAKRSGTFERAQSIENKAIR